MLSTLWIFIGCCSLAGSLSTDLFSNTKYIDGTEYTLPNIGLTYKQRVSHNGQCSIELNEKFKLLTEGEIIRIKNKWFKVEECRLNRAYRVPCSSKLYYQLRDLTCSFSEETNDNKIRIRRETNNEYSSLLDRSYQNICCESACTISEFLQYCPTRW